MNVYETNTSEATFTCCTSFSFFRRPFDSSGKRRSIKNKLHKCNLRYINSIALIFVKVHFIDWNSSKISPSTIKYETKRCKERNNCNQSGNCYIYVEPQYIEMMLNLRKESFVKTLTRPHVAECTDRKLFIQAYLEVKKYYIPFHLDVWDKSLNFKFQKYKTCFKSSLESLIS